MQVTQEAQGILFGQSLPSVDQVDAFATAVNAAEARQMELKSLIEQNAGDKARATGVGIAFYIVGRDKEAVEKLSGGRDSLTRSVFLGRALRRCRRFDEAMEAFAKAQDQKGDVQGLTLEKAETLTQAGRFEEAKKLLKTLANFEGVSSDYHYQQGRLLEAQSQYAEAAKQYEKAVTLEAGHSRAIFRLAYMADVVGNEEQAIEYYEQMTAEGPSHVSAFMNLAVLYEDAGDYELACKCVDVVLSAFPNHGRARLFKKDIESAKTMVYDDERERKLDKRNKLLETPITDFELSVRSRNCLRKMNIRTLGDLLNISEPELLAYKNFGETSLREIRAILESKNLRLGMAVEEKGDGFEHAAIVSRDNMSDLLNKNVDDLALSVRARKCLERLGVATTGELITKTEAELLGCKNFGVTSLNEIKGKLTDLGLALRKLD